MSDSQKLFFAGNTLQQAVLAAARHFGIDVDEVAYRPRDRRHGFVKATRRVVIEVDPAAPRRLVDLPAAPAAEPPAEEAQPAQPFAPRPAPRTEFHGERGSGRGGAARRERRGPSASAPAPPRSVATAELAEAAVQAADKLLEFARLRLEAKVRVGADDRLEVSLVGPDEAEALKDEGAALLAVEHLLPRVLRGLAGESIACRVDCGDFRARREETLRQLAQEAAAEVRRTGRPVILEELPPNERRLVHLALADDPDVETESLGDGFFKRVTVRSRSAAG